MAKDKSKKSDEPVAEVETIDVQPHNVLMDEKQKFRMEQLSAHEAAANGSPE